MVHSPLSKVKINYMNEMNIKSYKGEYQIDFVENIKEELPKFINEDFWVILDNNVKNLYQGLFNETLSDLNIISIDATEDRKSYEGIIDIIENLIEGGFKRNNKLLAIGGGITQDVTAFISSVLYRGVDWYFLPTNLLSQADSCIGSKTSINFKKYKNQIGGFYPPKQILIDPDFLKTLEDKELRSGLGEMAHYFLIDGDESFNLYRNNLDDALERGESFLQLIKVSLSIKKKMIEIDEFDQGPRNIFNYGHSFGHAIEGYTNYAIPHGIAVSYGMDIANAVSEAYGFLEPGVREDVRSVLSKIWMKTTFPDIDLDTYVNTLRKDKKNIGSNLRLILTKGLGNMFIHRLPVEEKFLNVVEQCFARFVDENK